MSHMGTTLKPLRILNSTPTNVIPTVRVYNK
jgi:hypothetical protein